MHRGGSGRDLAGFPPATAAATAADEQQRRLTEIALPTYAAAYPYAYSNSTAHAYADYSNYEQYGDVHCAEHGAVETDTIPPLGDGGLRIPYSEDPQFPFYGGDQHALPPQPHELHHRGTVFASVESARWASETDLTLPHRPGDADPSESTHSASQTQAQPESNPRSHQRRCSSGLVVGETVGAGDDPSSASVRRFFIPLLFA